MSDLALALVAFPTVFLSLTTGVVALIGAISTGPRGKVARRTLSMLVRMREPKD
ncbi:hypothetical protein GCM10027427_10250 [Pseudoclavibacter terrae]